MATSDDDLDLAESEADPAVPFDHGSHLHPNPQWPVYPKPIGPAPKPPPPALLPMPRTANALCRLFGPNIGRNPTFFPLILHPWQKDPDPH